jgi:Raf kinase inhibitor-like YbhB/YbcL family protein
MTMMVSSPVSSDGDEIPQQFTCDGDHVSPPFDFAEMPSGTAEVAVLVEDPDAPGGTFVHWVLWGVDPGQSSMAEGDVPAGAAQGRNDFGTQRYGGPCPPRGRSHRYVFNVFALSKPLDLAEGASAADLRRATAGNVLASASLTGRYGRR